VEVRRVLLAEPRGFCAGVQMAIKALSWMVRIFEPPVYCYHQIVHNEIVVERFRHLGVVFVDDVSEVPPGRPLMLSAHGTAPQVEEDAAARAGVVVNAVCPLVTKVHHEVKVRASRGFTILYVGHRGHEEAIGTVAVAPEAVRMIEPEDGLDGVGEIEGPVALVAQTTLSHQEWAGVVDEAKRRYPNLWMPARSDLCFATTNRQAALSEVARRADAVVVIGSANSSNTRALEKVARAVGCPRVVRVNRASELPEDLAGTVAVTAGASAPEELVEEVVAALCPEEGTEVVHVLEEDEYFPPPPELRELLRRVALAVAVAFGQELSPIDLKDDRVTEAQEVLDQLLGATL
jgi:4-hydroxy-3-methylbut-2-enyl diphosphate reductase